MANIKLATFKIDEVTWQQFRDKAAATGSDASKVLKAFVSAYLDGTIDPTLPQQQGIDSGIESRLEAAIAKLQEQVSGIDDRLGKLNGI